MTSINIRPQLDLRSKEPDDFEIRRLPSAARTRTRQRSRVRQRTRVPVAAEEEQQYYY